MQIFHRYWHEIHQLLLDLLAETKGIAPCLQLLCLFEKRLLESAKVENINVILQELDSDGSRDVEVKFKDSKAVEDIFSQIPDATCTYAVEITPHVKEVRNEFLKIFKDFI